MPTSQSQTFLTVSEVEITEPELGRTAVFSGLQPTGTWRLPFSAPLNTEQPHHATITHREQTALFLTDLMAQLLSGIVSAGSVMQDKSLWLAEPGLSLLDTDVRALPKMCGGNAGENKEEDVENGHEARSLPVLWMLTGVLPGATGAPLCSRPPKPWTLGWLRSCTQDAWQVTGLLFLLSLNWPRFVFLFFFLRLYLVEL